MKSIDKFTQKFFDKSIHCAIASNYLSSLFETEGRFSLETVAREHNISYEKVHHFISDSVAWNEEEVNNERLIFLNQHKFTKTKDTGVLALDDTQFIKCGKHTDGVSWQHCGNTGRDENCLTVVTSHYTDPHKNFPCFASTYYSGEETKLELAISQIDSFFTLGLDCGCITFDSWYLTKSVVRAVEKHHKLFVSVPKINRVFSYWGKRLDARSLVTASSTTGVCFDKKVTVKDMGRYRLIIQDGQMFLSNDFKSSTEGVIAKYRQRWTIDENYRKMKDKLNLEGFQMRKPASILRHLYLVFLAFTFFVWVKTKHIFSRIFTGTIEKVSDLCQVIRNLSIFQRAKMQISDLLSLLQLKPNFQV